MSESATSFSSALSDLDSDAESSSISSKKALEDASGTITPPTSPQVPQAGERQIGSDIQQDSLPVAQVEYPLVDSLTQQGARSALEVLTDFRNESSYYRLVSHLFGNLDYDTYNTLLRVNHSFNDNLSELYSDQPDDWSPSMNPLRRLERFLPQNCDEFDLNQLLVNQPGYNGYCPNEHDPLQRRILRPCEGIPRHEFYEQRPISKGAKHQTPHLVCNECRDIFWNTAYPEPWERPRTNHRRLRIILEGQHPFQGLYRAVCQKCDYIQRNLHPRPFDGCTCYHDIFTSHWRCMRCTRVTLQIVDAEARYKVGRLDKLRRDSATGRLHFDRRRPYSHTDRCLCDRRRVLPLTTGRQTLQCVRCEGYIVRTITHNPEPIRRSQRVQNRKLRGEDQPELEILTKSRGGPQSARTNKHGFAL